MHLGILLKNFLPLTIYLFGLFCALSALGGNSRWAILLITFMMPLRNILEKVQDFPGGTQFIDILLVSLIVGWFSKSGTKGRKLFESSSLNGISVMLVFYLFISLIIGGFYIFGQFVFDIHDSRVQDWKNFCVLPLLYFIILNSVHTKKEIWEIVAAMCVAMCIMDYYTFNQVLWYSSLESRSKISATFQFLGPNEVAAFFNEYTIILLSLLFALKKGRIKILLTILIYWNFYSIVFTYSRGAYGGMAIGMMILFLLKNKKLLIPLILVVALWQAVLPEKAVERIKGTKNESGQLDESSQRRINIWQQAMALFQKNPVVGIGYGAFRYLGLDLGDTHNIYVKILTEQGLVGLLILVLALFCFIREGFYLYQKGEDELEKALGLGLCICIVILAFNNFFGDRWSYMEPNAYLWIFGALVCRLNAMTRLPKPQTVEEAPQAAKAVLKPRTFAARPKKKVRYYDL